MRASKDAIRTARSLFRLCFVDGLLNDDRVRLVANKLTSSKPRGYVSILQTLKNLVRLEIERRSVTIESAQELDQDSKQRISHNLTEKYGQGLTFQFVVTPELLGGLRIQVGDDVFDGSVQSRLKRLAESF